MSKYVKARDMKVGEKYWFVDIDFSYPDVKLPTIKKRTIYRIVGGDFSTRENGDRYEVIRVIAHTSEKEAREYALKQLQDYKKYFIKKVDEKIEELTKRGDGA
jgi:hypothetical protein